MAKTEVTENDDFYHSQEDCYQPNARMSFLNRPCCQKHIALGRRTLGFFKIEQNGTEMSVSTARAIVHITNKIRRRRWL